MAATLRDNPAMASSSMWQRFQQFFLRYDDVDFSIDISRMNFPDGFLDQMQAPSKKAFHDMRELEGGAIANPDEKRMVGHYWLRNAGLAPSAEICREIENMVESIKDFAAKVHAGKIAAPGGAFKNLLLIGIGGSALGPQFVSNALSHP